MLEDLASVMFDEEALKEKCRELGQQIAKDYEGKDLLVVGISNVKIVILNTRLQKILKYSLPY